MRLLALSAALALVPLGCTSVSTPAVSVTPPEPSPAPAVRYVALGDSYTIGTGVGEGERWPNQLVERLTPAVQLELVGNLAVNGYTSGDVIDAQLPELSDLRPEFVSLLIGVNDVVQRVPEAEFRANVATILGALLDAVPPERVVVVSTPDYTRTPRGSDFGDPAERRAQIARFNEIVSGLASEHGVAFVDIGAVADGVDREPALVARDGLHPSGLQYARWVDLIAPVVARLFGVEAGAAPQPPSGLALGPCHHWKRSASSRPTAKPNREALSGCCSTWTA